MLKQFKYKEVVWVDLESPTPGEVEKIGAQYQIHPLVLHELSLPSERSKVDVYNDYLYLVLHFPKLDNSGNSQEIDFVLGRDFIITAHYEFNNALNDFSKIFETDFSLKKNQDKIHAGFIFFYVIKEIYAALESNLGLINRKLKTIAEQVFSGHEREVVKSLSQINRELLECQWTLKAHKEIFESLELAGEELFGAKFRYYLLAIAGEDRKIWKLLENSRNNFNDLHNTNESLLTIKTNETMKEMTVIALIFLPLNLVAQISTPSNFDLLIMPIVLIITLFIIKKQKWL